MAVVCAGTNRPVTICRAASALAEFIDLSSHPALVS
jgi:hypothetical protein